MYAGSIVVGEEDRLWHVKYDDSDSEDMNEEEIRGARKLYIERMVDDGDDDDDDDYVPMY